MQVALLASRPLLPPGFTPAFLQKTRSAIYASCVRYRMRHRRHYYPPPALLVPHGTARSRGAPYAHTPGPYLADAGGSGACGVVPLLHHGCNTVQREAVGCGVAAAAGLRGGQGGHGEGRGGGAARLAAAGAKWKAEDCGGPGIRMSVSKARS